MVGYLRIEMYLCFNIEIMSKVRLYEENQEKPQAVNEPMVVYGTMECYAKDYLKGIPQETMQSLVDLAIEDYEMGHCIPHSQMGSWMKERMGWK